MPKYHLIPWSKYGNYCDGRRVKVVDGEREEYNFTPQANKTAIIAQLISTGRIFVDEGLDAYDVIFNGDVIHVVFADPVSDNRTPIAHLYLDGTEEPDIPKGPEDIP